MLSTLYTSCWSIRSSKVLWLQLLKWSFNKKIWGFQLCKLITCTNHLKMQLLPGLCICLSHWQNQQQCWKKGLQIQNFLQSQFQHLTYPPRPLGAFWKWVYPVSSFVFSYQQTFFPHSLKKGSNDKNRQNRYIYIRVSIRIG